MEHKGFDLRELARVDFDVPCDVGDLGVVGGTGSAEGGSRELRQV